MKVLNVIGEDLSSSADYALSLCKGLKEQGHETALIGLPYSAAVAKAREAGIQTFEAELNSGNPLKLIQAVLKFRKADKEFKPDVVICHGGELFFYFTHVRYWESPKWKLVRVRGDRRPPKTDPLTLWLYKNSVDSVVTLSEERRREIIERLRLPENKVTVLYGGIDTGISCNNRAEGQNLARS